ncbi:MAG: glucuronate isomerase [Oscillospiraceae bacterium]
MKPFMDEDFLLASETAQTLYHSYAAKMPIIDYHCHINPQQIFENHKFADLAEAWLGGDHYKWRLMRSVGTDEKYVTGSATGWEKFYAFAQTLEKCIGNPVYHWAHLELKRYFGCSLPLNTKTAREIWDLCNEKLQNDPALQVRGIIEASRVTTVVTTDDPIDSLEWHEKLRQDQSFATKVLPAWRPDKAVNINQPGFVAYVEALSAAAGLAIADMKGLQSALAARMQHFANHGCKASDHGISGVAYAPASAEAGDDIFKKRLAGEEVTAQEIAIYQYALMLFLGREYARLGWVMELHFGAQRSINSKMLEALGPDTGYDTIDPVPRMPGLAEFLNRLNAEDLLPKTLIFSLEPADNAVINSLVGAFQQSGIGGKVQQGSAWWFNDTKTGMVEQITSFANFAPLGNFVGMLTDSRSFLSYTRHEYFRRILCNLLGGWVENGEYPADLAGLGALVQDISYNNAITYFGY